MGGDGGNGRAGGTEEHSGDRGGDGADEGGDEDHEHWRAATVGLAKLALIRGEPRRAVDMLGECGTTDPAVIELRGKARAALGDLDGAREQLQLALKKFDFKL